MKIMEHMFSRKLRGQLNMLKSKCTQTIKFRQFAACQKFRNRAQVLLT